MATKGGPSARPHAWFEPRRVSRAVLRLHGSFLVLLTSVLIVASLLGTFEGVGPLAFLEDNPLAEVGLFQAYALMMVVGVVLWMGSYQTVPFAWDGIGLLAHVAPLAATFLFSDTLATVGTPSTVPLHGFWILAEAMVIANAGWTRVAGRGPA